MDKMTHCRVKTPSAEAENGIRYILHSNNSRALPIQMNGTHHPITIKNSLSS